MSTAHTFGTGPLSRATALVYTLLVVEGLLVLTTLPTVAAFTFLARDASNVPLAALAALPVGPAVAAALTALRTPRDPLDLRPATAFWHGYRRDAVQVLKLWTPALAVLAVLGINLTHLDAGGVPSAWAVPLFAIGLVTVLWVVNAIAVASQFAFRTRDVARLAVFFLFAVPVVPLGVASVLALAAVVTVVTTEAFLLLLGAPFVGLLLLVTRPLAARVARDFVAAPDDDDPDPA